jgi:glucose-6-phosphate 1-dehydrogenase
MPDRYQIIGSSPDSLTDDQFREHARQATAEFGTTKPTGTAWQDFQGRLSFASADPPRPLSLVDAIARAEQEIGGTPRRLFHLAIPPAAFESTVTMLGTSGLARGSSVIIERPFGTDLASARELNATLHASFGESPVFRIDHFLGKESGWPPVRRPRRWPRCGPRSTTGAGPGSRSCCARASRWPPAAS